MIAEFIERECLAARSHVDRGKARDAPAQYGFEFRLIETVGVVPALRPDAAAADQQQQFAVGADVTDVATNGKQWQQLLRQTHCLNKPHALAVERYRPRQVVDRRFAFEHDDAEAVDPQQIRKRRTDRPVADNADIEFGC